MTVFHRRVGGFCIVLILLALILSPVTSLAATPRPAAQAQPSAAQSDDLPPPELTLGARGGDGVFEGFGDILAPVLALKSGIVFVNPRASGNDHNAEEYNLGVGYRHLLRDKGMIFGANVYYDYRETEQGGTFNQAGLGVEYLSDWVDARANYYLPEHHTETVESDVTTVSHANMQYTQWGDPYAEGNSIYQNGTFYRGVTTTETTQHFIQYEEAMEGFDVELGVRLPIPTIMDYADVKVFGGYYHYNRELGLDDLNGFKGRVEIKAMPSLYLDAEVYDSKDLTGRDYYLGARLSVPFDVANISKGRNPFAGAVDGMKFQKQKTTIASRLTEMVMRDLHVQTEYSEATEEVSQRTSVSSTVITNRQGVSATLATDVLFVNQDTGNDANPGTMELPLQQIQTGVARGSNVFVMATVGPYLLNLEIGRNVNLMGQGFPIGNDGKYLNGDSRFTVIQGVWGVPVAGIDVGGPTIFVNGRGDTGPTIADGFDGADNVQIRGFEIRNELGAVTAVPHETSLLDSVAVGVNSVENFELAYNRLDNAIIGLGAVYYDMPGFTANVHDNTFDTLGVGAAVVAVDSQGSLTFHNNTIQNTAVGLVAAAVGIDPLTPAVLNAEITDNSVLGGGLGIMTSPNFSLGGVAIQDILPIDVGSLTGIQGIDVLPEDLPSLSALNVAAITVNGAASAAVNATITGNHITDNILGLGAVGVGSNASLGVSIQNNVLTGGGLSSELIGDASAAVDLSGIGIWLLGLGGAHLNNAVIANNTITDHALGIGVLGLGQAQMNNGLIANNTISDSLLGVVIAGIGEAPSGILVAERPLVQMNDWTISGNRISGNGVGQIVDAILPIIPTNIIPQFVNDALQAVAIPDVGIAGILVVGSSPDLNVFGVSGITPYFYSTQMNGYQITGNLVENELLGIGIAGLGSDVGPFTGFVPRSDLSMNDYTISGNTIQNNLLGLVIAGDGFVGMENYEVAQNNLQGNVIGVAALSMDWTDQSGLSIHDNTIVGGNLDDALAALQPLADTNIIDDIDIVNALKLPLPDTGAIGVLVLNAGADTYDVSIANNAISKNLVGVLVAGMWEADMDGLDIANNTINDSVLGVGVLATDDTYIYGSTIRNNVINNPGIGILAMAEGTSRMTEMTISGNQVNQSLLGVLVASEDSAIMSNLVISANTISGANDPTQVALLSGFFALTDMTKDMGWILHREWNPALFPNSGLIGVNVRINNSEQAGVRIEGNRLSGFAQAGQVTLEDVNGVPITYLNNTSSDGAFYVAATNASYVLTQSGNTPSPVIETP
jgi:hypothetical protein